MFNLTEKQWGWVAGFLEGEGCFYLNKRSPCVQAGQVQREPLERLHNYFGGSIKFRKSNQLNHQDSYSWYVFGDAAISIIAKTYAQMSPKRKSKMLELVKGWHHPKMVRLCKNGHKQTINSKTKHSGCRNCFELNQDRRNALKRAAYHAKKTS